MNSVKSEVLEMCISCPTCGTRHITPRIMFVHRMPKNTAHALEIVGVFGFISTGSCGPLNMIQTTSFMTNSLLTHYVTIYVLVIYRNISSPRCLIMSSCLIIPCSPYMGNRIVFNTVNGNIQQIKVSVPLSGSLIWGHSGHRWRTVVTPWRNLGDPWPVRGHSLSNRDDPEYSSVVLKV